MIIPERQTIARHRISKIQSAIQEAVDKICKEEKYQITYAEINSAMLDVMKTYNGHELRELWKDNEKD